MQATAKPARTVRRGRPRDERIDVAVRACVLKLLAKGGYAGVSILAVARRIGCSRATLYRRWHSRAHLVAEALLQHMGKEPAPDTGRLRTDLQALARNLVRALAGPAGRALPSLLGDMTRDRGLARAFRREVLGVRRRSIRRALERGVARGDMRAQANLELFIDLLTAPFYFRRLYQHTFLTRREANQLVELALRAGGVPARRGRVPEHSP